MNGAFSGEELFEAEEVARYLGVKQTTVYRWCREGFMACFKVGKSWRIRRSAVEDFLRERERPATLYGRLKQFPRPRRRASSVSPRTPGLLHWLDAAFLRVGEERGARLVKFHGGEPAAAEELREEFRALRPERRRPGRRRTLAL